MVGDNKSLKYELQNIIKGDEHDGEANLIKTAQTLLRNLSAPGSVPEEKQQDKSKEERALAAFASENSLWVDEAMLGTYITEGAEQKIFFPASKKYVIKLADGVFYTSWLDYFISLLLHNSFFPSTSYSLIGFLQKENKLYVVLSQPFVLSTEITNLDNVRSFMLANGFLHKKNNDYYHPYLGIILEDLHDENVLTNDGVLFFVDTVFYITNEFYQTP